MKKYLCKDCAWKGSVDKCGVACWSVAMEQYKEGRVAAGLWMPYGLLLVGDEKVAYDSEEGHKV